MIIAIVVPASVKLCGTLATRFAPWEICTMKALGKPCTWMPCFVRIPSAQASDSLTPSRPRTSYPAGEVSPAVHHAILVRHHHGGLGCGEILEPALLPTRRGHLGEPLGIGRPVVPHVHRRRCSLEDEQLLARLRETGHTLHGGR